MALASPISWLALSLQQEHISSPASPLLTNKTHVGPPAGIRPSLPRLDEVAARSSHAIYPERVPNAALKGRELIYDFAATLSGTIPNIQQVLNECLAHQMSDG